MQDLKNAFDFRASLIGTIGEIGITALGAPVDTQGFSQVLACLISGAVAGTAGALSTLAVKIQESSVLAGTGSEWSDIDDGQVNGTMEFTTVSQYVGTYSVINMQSIYEKVSDGVRKRFIRAHATASGTAHASPKFSVGFILGVPVDTVHYIVNPTTQATSSLETTTGV